MVRIITTLPMLAAMLSFVPNTLAHPGEHHDEAEIHTEIAKRTAHANHIARGLSKCAGNANYHGLQSRALERRWAKAQNLRRSRGLPLDRSFKTRRDLTAMETFEAENHNYTSSGYSTSSSASSLFANYNNISCILTPEVTYGPYYVTGELIRSDVVGSQEGVAVHLEYQFIDISTCDAVEGLYVDTWQANSTGVYSGVQASGNGNDDDATNLNATFLRGVQPTDSEGIAAFDTLFAGHYEGRATHIHLMAHHGGTVLSNNTYVGGNVTHIGQIFFQEELKDAVEATYPYNTNTQAVTTNDEDMWAPDQADNSYDPFPDYAYLGDDITDGLLMWISVGVDLSSNYTYDAAAAYTADGGVAESNSLEGAGGSGGNGTDFSGNGTMPDGSNSTMTAAGNGTAPTGSMSGSEIPSSSIATSSAVVVAATSGSSTSTASTSTTVVSSSTVTTLGVSSSSTVSSASSNAAGHSSSSASASSNEHSTSSTRVGSSTSGGSSAHSGNTASSTASRSSGSASQHGSSTSNHHVSGSNGQGVPSDKPSSGYPGSGLQSGANLSRSANVRPSGSPASQSDNARPSASPALHSGDAQPTGASPSGFTTRTVTKNRRL